MLWVHLRTTCSSFPGTFSPGCERVWILKAENTVINRIALSFCPCCLQAVPCFSHKYVEACFWAGADYPAAGGFRDVRKLFVPTWPLVLKRLKRIKVDTRKLFSMLSNLL